MTEQAVFRSEGDPNLVLILHRFATLEQAHAFVDSNPDLMGAMAKCGVVASTLTTEFYQDE